MPQNLKSKNNTTLRDLIAEKLETYFAAHEGELPSPGLYKRMLGELEQPLLKISLSAVGNNQIKAAELLGINRNTLRKKLNEHNIEIK